MRRVLTALVLAGAIALAGSRPIFAQHGGGGHAGGFGGGHGGGFSGGHVGGFSGGHVGGFPGGGFAGPRFTAPAGGLRPGGFPPAGFPAPRMSFTPGPVSSGYPRFAPPARPYGGFAGPRSPFGQLSIPSVRRAPYPGAGSRSGTNQPYHSGNNNWHSGDHNGDHDGHHHYRPPYYFVGAPFYSSPYYPYGYWPYFGDWDSEDYSPSDQNASPDQYQNQYPYPYPYQYPGQNAYPDQNSAPPPPPPDEDAVRPAYQPPIAASPGVAISEPTVIIVYKDGHSEQVHNYALTPTNLLLMDNASAGYSLQVPLALVDLPATVQANRAVGVDFRLPVRN